MSLNGIESVLIIGIFVGAIITYENWYALKELTLFKLIVRLVMLNLPLLLLINLLLLDMFKLL